MRHGSEIDHEGGRPKIVDGGIFGLDACGRHRFLEPRDGKLSIRLTEGDQSNARGHKISDITLEECGQSHSGRNSEARRRNSKNDGHRWGNMVLAEYFRKAVKDRIGPYLA